MKSSRQNRLYPMRFGFSEIVLLGVLAGLGLALVTGSVTPSHDVMLLLEVGERLLDGARPYVDYVETNPPLSHYIHAAIVGLGRALGISSLAAMWALVWLGTVAGAGALASGGRPVWGERSAVRAAAALAGSTVFLASVGELGQREHLFVILFLPWIVHRSRVAVGQNRSGWGLVAGVLGAVGVCIKPHFLLIAAALEGWVVWRARTRWAEPGLGAFTLTGLLYPLHFLLLPEEVNAALFEVWLPVLSSGYRVYGDPGATMPLLAPIWCGVASFALVGLAAQVRSFGIVALASLGVYFLQWKGWLYHLVPAVVFAAAAVAMAVEPWVVGLRGAVIRGTSAAAVLIAGGLLVQGVAVPHGGDARRMFEARISPGERVLVLSTDLPPSWPWLALRGVRQPGTYPVAFPLAVLFPDGHEGPFGEPQSMAEAIFREDLVGDLAAAPKWVLIDARSPCPHCEPGVDFPNYLEGSGISRIIEQDWEKVDEADGLELWKRRSASSHGDP